jgi:hypothetical protein
MHRSFHVGMAHCSHHRSQVPGTHKNPSAAVLAGTIKDQFFGKTGSLPHLSKQAIYEAQVPEAERLDGNTQPSVLVQHRARKSSKTRWLIGTSRRPSGVLVCGTKITRSSKSRFFNARAL